MQLFQVSTMPKLCVKPIKTCIFIILLMLSHSASSHLCVCWLQTRMRAESRATETAKHQCHFMCNLFKLATLVSPTPLVCHCCWMTITKGGFDKRHQNILSSAFHISDGAKHVHSLQKISFF